MSTRWIGSDHHFFHDNILKFCSQQRPFDNVDEMNEVIIDRHNALVKPKDHMFFFGDVVFGDANTNLAERLKIIDRMNGIKHLLGGNHDKLRSAMVEYQKYFTTIETVREFGHGRDICSHYPVHPQQLEERYKFNVHGHMHDVLIKKDNGEVDVRYINVCLDNRNLFPTSWEEINDEWRAKR